MESSELRQIDMKNYTFYYIDGMIKIKGFVFDNILIDEKSYKIILVYSIHGKALFDSISLRIRFDEMHGFIKIYVEITYLLLLGSEK